MILQVYPKLPNTKREEESWLDPKTFKNPIQKTVYLHKQVWLEDYTDTDNLFLKDAMLLFRFYVCFWGIMNICTLT